jgi:glycosyltransferase involved in cell wall biosynthesis
MRDLDRGPLKDLLVTTHTPVLRSGQAMRTYGVARALAANGGLTLLYVRFDAPQPDAAFRAIPGIELQEVVPSRGLSRLLAYGRARLARVPDGFARGISAELGREAGRMAELPGRGRLIADGPIAAAALARLARQRPVIYNAHNVESSFRGELSEGGAGYERALRRFERSILAQASESWMVSEADMRSASELCPQANLRLAPNVVDVSAIEPTFGVASEQRAIFVANFSYEPNRNGLRFLLEDVFPRVWEQLPDARLMLVGAGLDAAATSTDPRVQALGFVEDLAEAYEQARCAVVPLLQGGGSPLKLVEALAYGLPVVATPRAVAGLSLHGGGDCLVGDGAEEFAQKLVWVLRDGAPAIAHAGRRLAEQRYSIEALTALLQA